jgi:hypothetical protein
MKRSDLADLSKQGIWKGAHSQALLNLCKMEEGQCVSQGEVAEAGLGRAPRRPMSVEEVEDLTKEVMLAVGELEKLYEDGTEAGDIRVRRWTAHIHTAPARILGKWEVQEVEQTLHDPAEAGDANGCDEFLSSSKGVDLRSVERMTRKATKLYEEGKIRRAAQALRKIKHPLDTLERRRANWAKMMALHPPRQVETEKPIPALQIPVEEKATPSCPRIFRGCAIRTNKSEGLFHTEADIGERGARITPLPPKIPEPKGEVCKSIPVDAEGALAITDVPTCPSLTKDTIIDTKCFLSVVKKLQAHKSPGVDGWSNRIIKQLSSTKGGLSALFRYARLAAASFLDPEVTDLGRLIGVPKKDDGVRPIGIVSALTALVRKAILATIMKTEDVVDKIGRAQFAVGVREGLGCVAWTLQLALDRGATVASVDIASAYQSISRRAVLDGAERLFGRSSPNFTRYVRHVYAQDTPLFYRSRIIKSKKGVKQGDALATLLFVAGIADTVEYTNKSLRSHINEEETKEGITAGVVGFADDLFLFSNDKSEKGTRSMLDAMSSLKHDLEERGLKLKVEKTHVFTKESGSEGVDYDLIQGLRERLHKDITVAEGSTAVGTPVGSDKFIEENVKHQVDLISAETTELLSTGDIKAPTATTILRLSLATKTKHIARSTNPRITVPILAKFDEQVRSLLRKHALGLASQGRLEDPSEPFVWTPSTLPTQDDLLPHVTKTCEVWEKVLMSPARHGGVGAIGAAMIANVAWISGWACATAATHTRFPELFPLGDDDINSKSLAPEQVKQTIKQLWANGILASVDLPTIGGVKMPPKPEWLVGTTKTQALLTRQLMWARASQVEKEVFWEMKRSTLLGEKYDASDATPTPEPHHLQTTTTTTSPTTTHQQHTTQKRLANPQIALYWRATTSSATSRCSRLAVDKGAAPGYWFSDGTYQQFQRDRLALPSQILPPSTTCPLCGKGPLGARLEHFAGECKFSTVGTTARHNAVRDGLVDALEENFPKAKVHKEVLVAMPHPSSSTGTKRPDITIVKQGTAKAVDVTVTSIETKGNTPSLSVSAEEAWKEAATHGRIANKAEKSKATAMLKTFKHLHGYDQIPFAMDELGRLSDGAVRFIKSIAEEAAKEVEAQQHPSQLVAPSSIAKQGAKHRILEALVHKVSTAAVYGRARLQAAREAKLQEHLAAVAKDLARQAALHRTMTKPPEESSTAEHPEREGVKEHVDDEAEGMVGEEREEETEECDSNGEKDTTTASMNLPQDEREPVDKTSPTTPPHLLTPSPTTPTTSPPPHPSHPPAAGRPPTTTPAETHQTDNSDFG